MKRQRALLVYALGAAGRRRGRNVAIIVGLALVVGLFASVTFLTDSLRREFNLSVDGAPDLSVQQMVGGRPALIDDALASRYSALPAVRRVVPRVWGYLYLPSLGANLTIIGSEQAPTDLPGDAAILEGRPPSAEGEMVIGALLAERLGLRVGDKIALPAPGGFHLLEAVGVFTSETAMHTADVIATHPADARALLGIPQGMATDLAITLTTPDEAPVIARHIADELPSARILEKELLRRTYELTFDARGGLMAATLLPTLAALLLLAWERLTGLGELERREIGVLKALGWETRDVLAARVWESASVALTGAASGVLVGYLYVFLAGAPGLAGTLFGWSALFPPLELVPAVDATQILSLLAGVVIPFVAVSIVPAWHAAMLDPDAAMRGTP